MGSRFQRLKGFRVLRLAVDSLGIRGSGFAGKLNRDVERGFGLWDLWTVTGGRASKVRNVKQFRGGLVFKAHRLLYHSTLGLRVITKKKKLRGWQSDLAAVERIWHS